MAEPKSVVDEVIDAYGNVAAVQERFNYKKPMGVYNWRSRGIPKALIADIHIDTGISVERLKNSLPDIAADNAA